jgi:putative addiction module component (TIGR02574 family)
MSVDEIFREAHRLPVAERLLLADSLIESVDPPDPEIEQAWMEAIRRRIEDLNSGRVKAIPGEQFMVELRRRYPDA